MKFLPEESRNPQLIDIDHPQPDPEPETVAETRASSEPSTPIPLVTNGNSNLIRIDTEEMDDEFSSPAFVKRARTSYGSLYEGIDLFAEEDGTVRGKGRKRTRLSTSWKYSSRSPTPEREESPEVDEEQTPEPEPVAPPPRPTMTDGGCQTTPQEVDDAAEALATFSRGAVNVGGTTYANLGEIADRPAQGPVSIENSMPPPILQTFFPPEAQSSIQRKAPDSPRLRPQPSESLPLVSPLVSKSLFGFAEPVLPPSLPQQSRDQGGQSSNPIQASVPTAEPADEDLYSASPKRPLDAPTADFSGLQNPLLDVGGLGGIGLDGQFISENKYGEWQRDTANLSYASSPFKQAEHADEMEDERFYVEAGHEPEQFSHDGESQHIEEPISQQYPDLDELPQHQIPVWGGHSTVAYPDLPDSDDRIEDSSRIEPPPPHSVAMSRSHSNQSQAIDLTESSDEGEDQDEEDAARRIGSDAAESEGSMIDDDEEIPAGDTRSRCFQNDNQGAPQEEYDEDEEGYYEDEFEEDEDGIHASRGDYYEDEESEGSYDEDMEDDEEGPGMAPAQRDPVVIDLLSSDDEDAGDIPAPKQSDPKRQQVATRPAPASDEESEEDDDMQDDTDDQNTEERKPRQRSLQQIRQPSYQSDEEEESDIEEEADDHRHTRTSVEGPEYDDEEASQDSESESEVEAGEQRNVFADKKNYLAQKTDGQTSIENDRSDDASPKPQDRKSSIPTVAPIIYPKLFGMDGAHDEHAKEPQSQRLSDEGKASVEPVARRNENNGQLPTPDDTQRTEKIDSPEASFSASQDIQVLIHEPQVSSSESINLASDSQIADAVVEDTNVEVPETSVEVVITEPALNLTNQRLLNEDQELKTEETIIEEIVEKAKEEVSEDITIEEPETEETMIEEIVEKAREEALEEISKEETAAVETVAEDVTEETIIEEIVETAKEEALAEISMEETARDEHVAGETTEETSPTPEAVKEQILELQQQLDQPSLVSPRRSSRLVKPTLDLKENVRPSTPTKAAKSIQPTSARSDRTLPKVAIDEQHSSPQGHDASVELALASHDSPQKRHNLRRPSTASIDSLTRQHNLRNAPGVEAASPPSPRNLRKHTSTDTDTTPKQHDLRKHPLIDTNSQTKQNDLPKASVADLKLKLSRTLRTKLSEFTALKVLRYHLGAKLDVLAVATTTPSEPQRTKSTSRQFLSTFHVTDVSIGPNSVTEVQVFRPYKDALPVIQAGDGILLRNFQVISVKNRGFALRSEETSSWAVFKNEEEPEMRGPPVELADEEKNHMALLKQWYGSLDSAGMAKLARANVDKGATT